MVLLILQNWLKTAFYRIDDIVIDFKEGHVGERFSHCKKSSDGAWFQEYIYVKNHVDVGWHVMFRGPVITILLPIPSFLYVVFDGEAI